MIRVHCQELAVAEGIIVIHPNWWGMPPAILKGWVDRVIRTGVAYEFLEGDSGEGVPRGRLLARRAIVFQLARLRGQGVPILSGGEELDTLHDYFHLKQIDILSGEYT